MLLSPYRDPLVFFFFAVFLLVGRVAVGDEAVFLERPLPNWPPGAPPARGSAVLLLLVLPASPAREPVVLLLWVLPLPPDLELFLPFALPWFTLPVLALFFVAPAL